MDSQDQQSSWDDLARSLGADAPAEPAPPKSVYTKVTPSEERPKPAEAAPRQKATPQSWANLAADLGLEVPPPPPEPVPVERPRVEKPRAETPRAEAAPPRRERSEEQPAQERSSRRSEGRPRRERSERSDEPSGEDRPRRRGRGGRSREGSRRDDRPREDRPREDRPREERARQERSRRPHEEQETLPAEESVDEIAAAPAPVEAEPAEPVSTSGFGVSLWHKIFGTPEQQADKIAESASTADLEGEAEAEEDRRDWRQQPRREFDDGPVESESWESESVEFSLEDRGGDAGEKPEAELDDEQRPRRRRRGRGRGRGRGRREEGERTGDESSAESPIDRGDSRHEPRESEERREGRGRGRGGRSGRSRREEPRQREQRHDNLDDDGLEEIVLDDDQDGGESAIDGEESEGGGREAAAGHKSIPSWEEAIGMIVEINLSTRTDRRRSSAPAQSRGSGSRGGRSRGGRRRRKPS